MKKMSFDEYINKQKYGYMSALAAKSGVSARTIHNIYYGFTKPIETTKQKLISAGVPKECFDFPK